MHRHRPPLALALLSLLLALASSVEAQKPTREQGLRSLETLEEKMKTLCGGCVPASATTGCTVARCRRESEVISKGLVDVWASNYGKGPKDDEPLEFFGPSDSIGGYLCWDWAKLFEIRAQALGPPFCWKPRFGSAERKGTPDVHYWLDLYLQIESDECLVVVDDGFFSGDDLVHLPPWPGRDGWARSNLPLPPTGRELNLPEDTPGLKKDEP